MWRLMNKPQTLRVTRDLALQYSEMEPAPHDRALSERRLQVYRKLLNEGKFRPVTWASAWCLETDCIYRVNGKHTSVLLAGEMTERPSIEFYVTIEAYECEALEDVAGLYSTFDSKMQSRNAHDIYMSFAATAPELKSVPAYIIKSAVTGIAYAVWGIEAYTKYQAADRAELLLEHSDFVLWLCNLLTTGPTAAEKCSANNKSRRSAHLQRQPVIAVMFNTWQKDVKAATSFWQAVRDDSGQSPGCPDRKLSRYLLTAVLQGGGHGAGGTGIKEMQVKCLHAWNAWRRNIATDLKYYAGKPVPAVM